MIRKYMPEDRDSVIAVWAAATELAHPFLSDAFLRRERSEIAATHLPNAETWVWENQGRIEGFIALVGHEVGALFVNPPASRSGIGQALLEKARALHGDLEVEVFEKNAIGRAFYEKCGFVEILRKHHETSGHQVIRLRLAANKSRGAAERRR